MRRRAQPVDLYAQLVRWRRRFALSVVLFGLLAGQAAIWRWGAPRVLTGAIERLTVRAVPPLDGGASLSIAGPSFATRERATTFAAVVESSGAPAFVQALAETGRFQVLVGPYVSSAEAEGAQRALATRGLANTRLLVDDSLRHEHRASVVSRWTGRRNGQPGVLAAAAPGILAVVFEMPEAPREVMAQRSAPSTLDVDVQPVSDLDEEQWSAPAGTLLLKAISLEPSGSEPGRARFRLTVPPEAQSRVRLEGRRVYVDLAWPEPPWPGRVPRGEPLRAGLSSSRPAADAKAEAEDDAALRAAIDRFRQVQPFLLSAVDAPETDVLMALTHTLDDLYGSLPSVAGNGVRPARLREAIQMARSATAPEFAGDRALQARRAIALFQDAALTTEAAPAGTSSGGQTPAPSRQ